MTGEAYPCEKWYGGILNKYPMNNSFISRGPATSNISSLRRWRELRTNRVLFLNFLETVAYSTYSKLLE